MPEGKSIWAHRQDYHLIRKLKMMICFSDENKLISHKLSSIITCGIKHRYYARDSDVQLKSTYQMNTP